MEIFSTIEIFHFNVFDTSILNYQQRNEPAPPHSHFDFVVSLRRPEALLLLSDQVFQPLQHLSLLDVVLEELPTQLVQPKSIIKDLGTSFSLYYTNLETFVFDHIFETIHNIEKPFFIEIP
jgi:hypothetical protein